MPSSEAARQTPFQQPSHSKSSRPRLHYRSPSGSVSLYSCSCRCLSSSRVSSRAGSAARGLGSSLPGLDCCEVILQRACHCGCAVAGASPAAASAAELAALPEGWSSTKDAQGRTYFWHKTTKKVQWDRPTADTPIS